MPILQLLCVEVALIGIGAFLLWKPELIWKLDHLMDVKNGEPTDFSLAMIRLTGTVMVVGAVLLPVILLAVEA
ncbi:nickel ABC transporter permease [Bifidobacterium leontopitheci]|uniref:Nickel ABC transporter permease n=2 Tax=Bifidobacterium leontopitheci TaxID=2650774 RepID=A0A6I1GPZ4_9BIFI|nr:nickel ABC transporter permease [Bifidobacterium leontopitheci]